MLELNFHRNMAAPNALRYPASTVAAAAALLPSPPPAPSKVHVNPTMETKRFTAQDIPSLYRRTDIQRWYNVLHSRALICGVYTVPWKAFTKSSHMGDTWSLAFLTHEVMDRQGLMSAALHALLSSQDIFKGDCTAFDHMISNTEGDGYLALYQLVRLVHPSLGQATAQPQQPIHKPTQDFAEHIANYRDYFQSEECSGRFYSLNEKIFSIITRLHPTWRDAMKRKYITMVPQDGAVTNIPLECHLEMLAVTLLQWCDEDRLAPPQDKSSSAPLRTPTSSLFELQDTVATHFPEAASNSSPSEIYFGAMTIAEETVDRYVEHIICYVARGSEKGSYPKCVACGFPGHTIDKCFPLVFFCIAQALASQHPEIVKKIKATFKTFARTNRSRPPRVSSVKQLVSLLDLPPVVDTLVSPDPSRTYLDPQPSPFEITQIDFSDPDMTYGQIGDSVVTFQHRPWFPSSSEPPAATFMMDTSSHNHCILYQEPDPSEHSVSQLRSSQELLVDSGSTITTIGNAYALSDYVTPSKNGIAMRSSTGQIVKLKDEGRLTFAVNAGTGTLYAACLHTPDIKSSIFSPEETCDSLKYSQYQLTCNRYHQTSTVHFTKDGAPDILLQGSYIGRMPFISLAQASIASFSPIIPILELPMFRGTHLPELLVDDNDLAVHQILRLVHLAGVGPQPSANECRLGMFQLVVDTISDDSTHGGLPAKPVLHVSDAVNRTLWHTRMCHPNPERLVLLSKMWKGMPTLTHPQYVEKCSDCLVANLRKAARAHAPGFKATVVGQGLDLDVGFMFQKSKDLERVARLAGINGNNAYCVIYDFFSELICGVATRGKVIPTTWLHILLTRIAPKSTPGRIVRLDLGGETGKNTVLQALFLKHGYLMEPTIAGSSSQNGLGERPHQTIGNAIRVML
jgi:hypothetical protein